MFTLIDSKMVLKNQNYATYALSRFFKKPNSKKYQISIKNKNSQ
jgi:hypothetical protein